MVGACRIEVVVGGRADVRIGSVLRCGIGEAAAYTQLSDSEYLRGATDKLHNRLLIKERAGELYQTSGRAFNSNSIQYWGER
jgi:hypothetical protein